MLKIVIRAGGVGTRLWPESREKMPKQLHKLASDKSMLRETVDRLYPDIEPEAIFVSTNKNCVDRVIKELPDIPLKNIIVEPSRKDTAAACGLETVYIEKRFPNSIVASLGSDHLVRRPEEFRRVIQATAKAAKKNPEHLFCLGCFPTFPDTNFGYIKLGKEIDAVDKLKVYKVNQFTEKPDFQTAKKLISKGGCLWNANMFLWNTRTLLSLYKKFLPKMHTGLMKIKKSLDTDMEQETLSGEYNKLEKVAIDYAILEKSSKVAAVSLNVGWNDIGNWTSLKDELASKEKDNVIRGEHLAIDTTNSLIYGQKDKIVATIGVKDLIIVDTNDALLVCDKKRAPEVKKIVDELKKTKKEKYL